MIYAVNASSEEAGIMYQFRYYKRKSHYNAA